MSNPEQALWRAVIEHAILDACGKSTARAYTRELDRIQAADWLFKHSRGFQEVCALADLEPDQVRARAQERIDEAEMKRQRKLERRKTQCLAMKS